MEDLGEGLHPGPADADEVNVFLVFQQHKIKPFLSRRNGIMFYSVEAAFTAVVKPVGFLFQEGMF